MIHEVKQSHELLIFLQVVAPDQEGRRIAILTAEADPVDARWAIGADVIVYPAMAQVCLMTGSSVTLGFCASTLI